MKRKLNYLRGVNMPPIGFNLDGSGGTQWCNAAENKPVTAEFDSQGSNKEGCVLTEKQTVIQTCEPAANPVVECEPPQTISLQKGGKGHVR